jgi:uncharacterized protein YbjT (DUF2867 family)
MYVILGASGNTGSVVAETLLAKGQQVRVVGRSKERLARFTASGAEASDADVTKPAMLKQAFHGARAVYALLPPNITSPDVRAYQNEVTNAIADALEAAGVSHVVTLSSIGADKPDKTGPVVGLHFLEKRLAEIPKLNALHLRAGYFMENTLAQDGIIKGFGMMAGPMRGDLPLAMIASHDIGAAAAEALLKLDFTGQQTRELLGQRDITYEETAKIVGNNIGKPNLNYVQLPMDQIMQALTQMGMSKNMAALICEMAASLNDGYMRPLEARSPENTTPTTYEQFVKSMFLPAFKGQAKGA